MFVIALCAEVNMSKQYERLIAVAEEAWHEAISVCPHRDKDSDDDDPGNGPHCKNDDNQSGMKWCEPGSCPLANF